MITEDNNEYLYILDYSDCTVCEIKLDEKDDKLTTEEILYRRGLNPDECAFMYTTLKCDYIIPLEIEK